MNRFILSACCGLGLILGVSSLDAQQVVRGIFVTPIPNQPLTAVVQTERTVILPNGRAIADRTLSHIARDRGGQIYNELRASLPSQLNVQVRQEPQLLSVHIYDPKSRLNTLLNVPRKAIQQSVLQTPPAALPPDFEAAPQASSVLPNEFVKKEDLGWDKIEGLNVHGVREVQTIPAAQSGTGEEVTVTDEYWYSDDLRLNLMTKHNDPRTGSVSKTVTEIKRDEPDPAIFTVPSDYKFNVPMQGTRINLGARPGGVGGPGARPEGTPAP